MTAKGNGEKRVAVNAALERWRQGDCVVGEQWFVHRLALDIPLTEGAVEAAGAGVDLAESEVRGLIVVSQTCDVVRDCGERPYVEVTPLVEVNDSTLPSIEHGHRPRYAFVPGLEEKALVADLDRVMTVEKAVVASWTRTPGCATDQEMRHLSQAFARKRARWAFPDDFTELAGKLQNRMKEKHDKQSEEGAALCALREIRVRAAPSWESETVELMFWFIRNEGEPNFKNQSWDTLLESWLKFVPSAGRFDSVHGAVVTLDDLTAREYVESDPLDLDHLSLRSGG